MSVEPSGQWLKISPKMRGPLARLSWDAECAWWKMYLYSAEVGNDGRLPVAELWVAMDRKIPAKKATALAEELAAAGFLEIKNGVVVLDWSEQPLAEVWKDPVLRERWLRQKRLKNDSSLCKQIRDRDRNLCRYCGTRVNWSIKTKNHPLGATYDHVDPDGENSLENVVVACRQCNGRKKDRTPDQWVNADRLRGRTLKKPGTTAAQADEIDAAMRAGPAPGSTTGQPEADPGSTSPLRGRARPDRANPGLTPGQPEPGQQAGLMDRVSADGAVEYSNDHEEQEVQ